MDPYARLLIAIAAVLALIALALLTWIAVRVDALARQKVAPPPRPSAPRRSPLVGIPPSWVGLAERRPVDEEEINPTFPVRRPRR